MKKVLSCKIDDEIYNLIDKLPENHSTILRKALKEYIEKYNIRSER